MKTGDAEGTESNIPAGARSHHMDAPEPKSGATARGERDHVVA